MRKILFVVVAAVAALSAMSYAANGNPDAKPAVVSPELPMTTIDMPGGKIAHVSLRPDHAVVYDTMRDKHNGYIIVSKKDLRLYVYEHRAGEPDALIAHYPVCLSLNKGNKQMAGDMRTPESPAEHPFVITEINDASSWRHDFGDGRGSIKAYGHWFLRLQTGFRGIGIHGSTGNEQTVPGRASEGCIRLRDADIISLKENYAYCGMQVTILPD